MFDNSIHSTDILDQSLYSCPKLRQFLHVFAAANIRGVPALSYLPRDTSRGITLHTAKVVGAHSLNFKPILAVFES